MYKVKHCSRGVGVQRGGVGVLGGHGVEGIQSGYERIGVGRGTWVIKGR